MSTPEMTTSEQSSTAMVGTPRIGWTVALSLVFYLIAVAAGIGTHPAHRFWHSKADDVARADGDPLVSAVQATPPRLVADKPAGMLVTQAHDCALHGQWDCMSQASDAAQALHGTAAGPAAAPSASAAPATSVAAQHGADGTLKLAQHDHEAQRRHVQRVVDHPLAHPVVSVNPDPFFRDLYRH